MVEKDYQGEELSAWHRLVASSFGSVITALIMTPLDVVKVRMQSHRILSENKCFIYCNGLMDHLCTCPLGSSPNSFEPWYKKRGNFVGTWVGFHSHHHSSHPSNCIYHNGHPSFAELSQQSMRLTDAVFKIVRNEGVFSLWSGLSPTLVMALPQTVIYYTLNDWLKDRVGYSSRQLNQVVQNDTFSRLSLNDCTPAVIGAGSRVVAVAAISPIELLRTKMQSTHMTPESLYSTICIAVKQGGLRSMWLGMGPTLLRDVPYSMFFWLVFEYLKSRHLFGHVANCDHRPFGSPRIRELPFIQAFLFGAVSGLTAGILTHPFDVIKTHRQIQLGKALVECRAYPKSTWLSLHQLYSSNGVRALYAGFTPRLVKTTNASAVMIATFETFKRYFASSLEHI